MSLSARILIILSVIVALYAFVDHAVQRLTIARAFSRLEREEAIEDLGRVIEAIDNEIAQVDSKARNFSLWDATYAFVQDRNLDYIEENLAPPAFANHDIGLLYICNLEGEVVWGDIRDEEAHASLSLRDFPREALSLSHPLLIDPDQKGYAGRSRRGILLNEHAPLIVSAQPILPGDGAGPPRGTLILGRFLSPGFVQDLSKRTHVDFTIFPLEGPSLPDDCKEVLDEVTASPEPILRARDEEVMNAYATVSDMRALPALIVRADMPRDVSQCGNRSIRYALVSTLAAGLLLILALLFALQQLVLQPLAELTSHAVRIGKSEDFSARLRQDRSDEIGTLSREFDRTMEKLQLSRAALVETARTAGMSEIANGILHNVGNVLNSVNVSANVIGTSLQEFPLNDLEQLAELLAQHGPEELAKFLQEDSRGRHVIPFVRALSEQMRSSQRTIMDEARVLSGGVDHIRELINSQQSYAGKSELMEDTNIEELLEKALRISQQASAPGQRFKVVRNFSDLPRVRTDRHKLLEILVNLIQNARQALVEGSPEEAVLELTAGVESDQLNIEVRDNGIGIAPENLVKVFHHGFTTKKHGHGFGLHAAANAAKELGGRLTVRSDGPGRGAAFSISLPLAIKAKAVDVS